MDLLCKFLILSSLLIVATISKFVEEEEAERWIQTYNSSAKTPDVTLQVYAHDVLAGQQATVWEVARANITSNSSTDFGQVRVVDDLITYESDAKSTALGRLQGMITSSDLNIDAMVINMIFKFDSGPFNGSSLSVLGRSQILDDSRELIVTGGTGVFRMARGYVIGTTNNITYDENVQPSSVIFDYKIYLYHPCFC